MVSVGASEAQVSGASDKEIGGVVCTPDVVRLRPVARGERLEGGEVGGEGHTKIKSSDKAHQGLQ